MEKIQGRKKNIFQICILLFTAWLFSTVICGGIVHAVFYFPQITMEDRTRNRTSTDYRYHTKYNQTLCSYPEFQQMIDSPKNIAIPGLVYTDFGEAGSAQMVPQGICVTETYLFLTAYDKEKIRNSVLYVMGREEKNNGKLLATIVLPDRNHVGGITFDGTYLWIAKSSSGYCSAIALKRIEKAMDKKEKIIKFSEYDREAYCGQRASFVTYDEGYLWVGTYEKNQKKKGKLSCFLVEERDEKVNLTLINTIEIPPYVQGVTFLKTEQKQAMILSASSGRYRDSQIYVYDIEENQEKKTITKRMAYCFPPMSQEMASDEKYTYLLFESAATCYSTKNFKKCKYPVDRIVAIPNEKLLPTQNKNYLR